MISGVVVASRPEHRSEVEQALCALAWADVHYSDATGRLVVTVEALDVEESMERLQFIQDLDSVLAVSLAEYYMNDDEAEARQPA